MAKVGRPEKWTPDKIKQLGDELIAWFKDENNFWLGDFAESKELYPEIFEQLAAKSPEFTLSLKRAKSIQATRLMKLGLKGNAAMPIFALKNVAGWRDKTEQSFDGDSISEIKVTIIPSKKDR